MARSLPARELVVFGVGALAVLSASTGQISVPSSFPMTRFLAHWVFPTSILFATIALLSGVSRALFFSPFFMLVVGLTPSQAIGAGLLTEVFGMGLPNVGVGPDTLSLSDVEEAFVFDCALVDC